MIPNYGNYGCLFNFFIIIFHQIKYQTHRNILVSAKWHNTTLQPVSDGSWNTATIEKQNNTNFFLKTTEESIWWEDWRTWNFILKIWKFCCLYQRNPALWRQMVSTWQTNLCGSWSQPIKKHQARFVLSIILLSPTGSKMHVDGSVYVLAVDFRHMTYNKERFICTLISIYPLSGIYSL